jgi:hypothetical protein
MARRGNGRAQPAAAAMPSCRAAAQQKSFFDGAPRYYFVCRAFRLTMWFVGTADWTFPCFLRSNRFVKLLSRSA